jgi:hypothetical protein
MLKKIGKVLGVIVLLFFITAFALRSYFKGILVDKVKQTINEEVNAVVDFGGFDIALITSFPQFKFSINQLTVVGVDTFQNDTLLKMGELNFRLNLMDVIGGNYEIQSFGVEDLEMNALVLQNGKVNWDIVPTSEEEEEVEEEESGDFKFKLKKYYLKNINIDYKDLESNMSMKIQNLNHEGSFKMEGDLMDIFTETSIDALSFTSEGVLLANKLKINAKADLALDMLKSLYTFKENEFKINELKMGVNGWVLIPDSADMEMDIAVDAKDNKFSDVLSLVPGAYTADFSDLKTEGTFNLSMWFKGVMNDVLLPKFNIDLKVKNSFVQYPDLPEKVKNIQMDLNVKNDDGYANSTLVDLKQLHLEIGKNPIDITFFLSQPETDPNFKGSIQSKLDLASLSKAIPLEDGEELKGLIQADIELDGKMSYVENEEYDKMKFVGEVSITDMFYKMVDMPDMLIKNANFTATPKFFKLNQFESQIGKSDLSAQGYIDNIFGYVFKDEVIKGNFAIQSNYFDVNEWMSDEETSTEETSEETSGSGVVEVPKNIDFELTSNFKKIDYDNMPITNFKGKLTIKNGEILFHDNSFNMLESTMSMKGKYSTSDITKPFVDMDFGIQNLDIPFAFKTFNTIKTLAPIAENAQGKMNLSIKFNSLLSDSMTPILNTINGGGELLTKSLQIQNSGLLKDISSKINYTKLNDLQMSDLKLLFKIADGKINVSPTNLKMSTSSAVLKGWNAFDNTMEYIMEFKVPRTELGGAANAFIGNIEKEASKLGVPASAGEFLLFDVIASGNTLKPTVNVKPRVGASGADLKNQLKNKAEEKINEVKTEVKQKVEEKKQEVKQVVDEKKQAVEAELEKQKIEAQKQADEIKKKAEAEKKKKEEEAKKKAAEELRKRFR